MTVEEELMRQIIELLKGFTIVGAIMLAIIYCFFMGVAVHILVNERKKNKKKPAEHNAQRGEMKFI